MKWGKLSNSEFKMDVGKWAKFPFEIANENGGCAYRIAQESVCNKEQTTLRIARVMCPKIRENSSHGATIYQQVALNDFN